MAASKAYFYAGDLVRLKSLRERVGIVERSSGDVSTHYPDVMGREVHKYQSISNRDFQKFKLDGVPPRETILLSWARLPWTAKCFSELIPISEIELVDRHCELGDRVKRKPTDSMSGTVVAIDIIASLLPPCIFPSGGSAPASEPDENSFGTFSRLPQDQLHNVPAYELTRAEEYLENDVVIYRGWIGNVDEVDSELTVRLSNGSVVVPEDTDDVKVVGDRIMPPMLGDLVTTKKANLRRGRWIYGAYDPNVEPCGYVVKSAPRALYVDWRDCRHGAQAEEPSEEMTSDDINSPDFRRHMPSQRPCSDGPTSRPSPPIKIGDRLRFGNLDVARENYGSTKLNIIPRTETLGYDLNQYLCTATQSTVVVQWQDLTESTHSTLDLVPTLDLDDEDEVWPGEIIATKEDREHDLASRLPRKIGVVQTVDARNRTAMIKWLQGVVSWARDDPTFIFPGSWTGKATGESELVSLYDIIAARPLSRLPGDLVVIKPVHRTATIPEGSREMYKTVERLLSSSHDLAWMGEVVSTNLDGSIVVRIESGVNEFNEVEVPIECTVCIDETFKDEEDGSDDEMDTDFDMDNGSDGDDPLAELRAAAWNAITQERSRLDGLPPGLSTDHPWMDSNNDPVNDDESWQTDEEDGRDSDEAEDDRTGAMNIDMRDAVAEAIGSGINKTDSASTNVATDRGLSRTTFSEHVSLIGSRFSYASMHGESPPAKLLVLEGKPLVTTIMPKLIIRYLQEGLPDGVYVRTWEGGMQYWRFMLLGPIDTPYEYAPFLVDMYLPPTWPNAAPKLFFHSYTDGTSAINPNLYEDGTICLSLLGTWSGESSETWTKDSTLLQIIVSILGLILVPEPYFNEAGFEVRRGTSEAELPSRQYTERAYFHSRRFLVDALDRRGRGVAGRGAFEDIIENLFDQADGPLLLIRAIWSAIQVLHRSSESHSNADRTSEGRFISVGAVSPLRRQIQQMISSVTCTEQVPLQAFLDDARAKPSGGPRGIYDELGNYS